MRRIPDRNIIAGLHTILSEETEKQCKNYSYNKEKKKLTKAKKYILGIILLIVLFQITKFLGDYKEAKEEEEKIQREYARQEILAGYTFILPEQTDFLSDTQELGFVSITYDVSYSGNNENSIEFTITGKGYPKKTDKSSGTGIFFVICYYNKDGKLFDSGYINDSMCKSGEQVEFTDTVHDLKPGVYSIKIFAQDDPERPAFLP